MPERRSSWPTVVGVIAIVFGAGGLLSGCWQFLTPSFLRLIKEMVPPGQQAQFAAMEMVDQYRGWTLLLATATTGVAALLLIVGIGLVRRRRWAVPASAWWSVIKMLLVTGSAAYGYVIQQATMSQMPSQIPTAPPLGSGFAVIMGVITVIITIVWGWALPVFLLIWMSRRPIKEETARWP